MHYDPNEKICTKGNKKRKALFEWRERRMKLFFKNGKIIN